jgi:hypothetical protein
MSLNIEKVENKADQVAIKNVLIGDLLSKIVSTNCDSKHAACASIKNQIVNLITPDTIGQLDETFLNSYIAFLCRNTYSKRNGYYSSYYNTTMCINSRPIAEPVFKLLLPKFAPSESSFKNIINAGASYVLELCVQYNVNIPETILQLCFDLEKQEMVKLLMGSNKCVVTEKHLEVACTHGWFDVVYAILDRKISPTPQALQNAILYKHKNDSSYKYNYDYDTKTPERKKAIEDTVKLVSTLISSGVQVTPECLKHACKTHNTDLVTMFLENKVNPDKTCFDACFESIKDDYYYSRYSSRRTENEKTIVSIINSLIKYGYHLTYDDVALATRNKIKLTCDISHIKFDEKFMELCSEVSFYPYVLDVKPSITCLVKECSKAGNLTGVKQMVKMGLVPTNECIEKACSLKNNIATIKYLTSQGASINLECVKNIVKSVGNRTLDYIFAEYMNSLDPNYKKEAAPVVSDDELDEDEINEVSKLDDEENDEGDKAADENEEANEDVKGTKSKKKVVKKTAKTSKTKAVDTTDGKVDEKVDEKVDDPVDEEEVKPTKGKKAVKKTVKVKATKTVKSKAVDVKEDVPTKVETESKPKTYETITVDPPKEQIQHRVKVSANDKLKKLFNYKDDVKVSFFDLRTKFTEYFQQNKLYDDVNQDLILIDKLLAETLGYTENKYLKYADIDNFIANSMQ